LKKSLLTRQIIEKTSQKTKYKTERTIKSSLRQKGIKELKKPKAILILSKTVKARKWAKSEENLHTRDSIQLIINSAVITVSGI
jgi:hypothetical protein